MKKSAFVLSLVVCWGLTTCHASAGEWQEAGAKTWAFGTSAFVVADKVLHWSWETLHNKIVHPIVNVVTLGTVNLPNS